MLLLFWKILSYFEKCFSYFVFSKIREAFLKIREAFPNIILLNTKQNLRKSGPEEVVKEIIFITAFCMLLASIRGWIGGRWKGQKWGILSSGVW